MERRYINKKKERKDRNETREKHKENIDAYKILPVVAVRSAKMSGDHGLPIPYRFVSDFSCKLFIFSYSMHFSKIY